MSDESDLLAAEYALGTLDAVERDAVMRQRTTDLSFDRAVTQWEGRLTPLAEGIAPVEPSPTIWRNIIAALGESTDGTGAGNVVLLRKSVMRWRAATVATGALAAALALFPIDRDLFRTGPVTQPGTYIAAINRGGDLPALIVRVDLANHSVTVRPVETETPPGKSLELWYIASGQAPKSMGVVKNAREQMAMPSGMDAKNLMLAVTVEPLGGSPTGAPTGPIVYKGMLVAE